MEEDWRRIGRGLEENWRRIGGREGQGCWLRDNDRRILVSSRSARFDSLILRRHRFDYLPTSISRATPAYVCYIGKNCLPTSDRFYGSTRHAYPSRLIFLRSSPYIFPARGTLRDQPSREICHEVCATPHGATLRTEGRAGGTRTFYVGIAHNEYAFALLSHDFNFPRNIA